MIKPGDNETLCFEIASMPFPRFFFIFVFASSLALCGLVANLFLLCFFAKKRNRTTPTFYLGVLALLDTIICSTYLAMMGVDAFIQYFQSVWLHFAWISYTIPVYTTYRVVQLSSSYVIMAATVERAILSSEYWRSWGGPSSSGAWRGWVVAGIGGASLALRLVTAWELRCEFRPHCPDPLGRLEILRNRELIGTSAHHVFDFYFLPLVQIFIPFFVLLLLNLANIKFLEAYNQKQEQRRQKARSGSHLLAKFRRSSSKRSKRTASTHLELELGDLGSPESPPTMDTPVVSPAPPTSNAMPMALGAISANIFKERVHQARERGSEQAALRSATYTLIAIVSTYLTCNVVSLVVSTLEHLPGSPLLFKVPTKDKRMHVNQVDVENGDESQGPTIFYSTAVDAINFLFMFNSFVRIIIYTCFNPEMRRDLKTFLFRSD